MLEYVKCVGAPVAFVVAETQSIAKDAAEIIEIDYEILESATDLSKVRSEIHLSYGRELRVTFPLLMVWGMPKKWLLHFLNQLIS